jgi:hypothetical protein
MASEITHRQRDECTNHESVHPAPVLGRPRSGGENAGGRHVAGQQTWARDIDLAQLLAVVAHTAALVGSRALYSI